MRKTAITFLLLAALLFVTAKVLAKGGEKGKGKSDKSDQIESKATAKTADVNRPLHDLKGEMRQKHERARQEADANRPLHMKRGEIREKYEREHKEKEQAHEMVRKGREKQKAAADVNEVIGKAGKGFGKEHGQQLKAIEKQTTQEANKHNKRIAQLNRMRELAVQKNDTKKVEKIDELIKREQGRYDSKNQRMQEKLEKVQQIEQKAAEQGKEKVRDKAEEEKIDVNKG